MFGLGLCCSAISTCLCRDERDFVSAPLPFAFYFSFFSFCCGPPLEMEDIGHSLYPIFDYAQCFLVSRFFNLVFALLHMFSSTCGPDLAEEGCVLGPLSS